VPLTLIRFASFFVILGSNNIFSGLRNYPSPQTNTERTHLPLRHEVAPREGTRG